ncbi:MAG: aminotransferase class V-fold PLP-dependent enzyme [Candidatus Aminicenantes bacterium]|nr:MAG: aminotransferase class V-fold PLP-dependent enzyme [Candidatus Aminicenantes bacterium]
MVNSRRDFLKSLGLGIGSLGVFGTKSKHARAELKKKLTEVKNVSPDKVAEDESFWFHIQQAFDCDRSIINLNNGGVHPAPKIVMDAVHRYLDFANGAPVYNSWRVLRPRKELIRKKLADTFGCSPEEIAITRNVTEAMQIALLGLDLNPGDEVLTTTHDYPSMKNALFQREKREGVKVKTFAFPYPPKNLKVLSDLFEKNVTQRTKLILVCHITNLTGQIFPIKDICQMARKRGIEVVIDGAHSFGHFVYKQKDLDCDIYGANLHKWMMGPIGTGFLYVKKEKIKKIWPLFPAPDPLGDDIRKFEHIGTQPDYLELAVGEALAFHHGIGAKRKEERLRYLRNYWAKALEKLPGVKILTSYNPRQSCGIGSFTVENMDMEKLSQLLFQKHKIYVIPVGVPSPDKESENITGMRVTPSIYTTLRELDIFIEAASHYIKNGLS